MGGIDRRGRLDGVRYHQLLKLGTGDAGCRAARKYTVRDIGRNAHGAVSKQRVGGVAERAAGIDNIVDQKAVLAAHVADDVHDFGLARVFAPLVDDGELCIEPLG